MFADATLGKRISETRKKRGFTVQDLALQTGVTDKTVKSWENGKNKPRANKMQMLAGILGTPLLWLLEGREQFDPQSNGLSQLEILAQKLKRMNQLQVELLTLSNEVAEAVEDLHNKEAVRDFLQA